MSGLGILFFILFLLLIVVALKFIFGDVSEIQEENIYDIPIAHSLSATLFPIEISVIFLLMIFAAAFCSDITCLIKIFYIILPVIISLCYVYKNDVLNLD